MAGTVNARLGETEKQSDERYGLPTAIAPTPGSDKTIRYEKDGIKISCEFVKDKCLRITYEMTPWEKLREAKFELIMQSEGGSVWANYQGGKPNEYARSDRLAIAVKQRDSITFMLNEWTKLYDQAVKDQAAAKKAAEKAAEHERLKKLGREL